MYENMDGPILIPKVVSGNPLTLVGYEHHLFCHFFAMFNMIIAQPQIDSQIYLQLLK